MKLLLCCKKTKPYLFETVECLKDVCEEYYTYNDNKYLEDKTLNGKVVVECDFEVEEIKVGSGYSVGFGGVEFIRTDTLQLCELLQKSCLSLGQLKSRIQKDGNGEFYGYQGYAIHIKNLHIFDEPKKLSEFGRADIKHTTRDIISFMTSKSIPKYVGALIKMTVVYDGWERKVIMPISSEEMCRILNKQQTIILRRTILKEVLKEINMSKELEALNVIKNISLSHVETEQDEDFNGDWVFETVEVDDGVIEDNYPEQIDIIENALKRLEQIDNISPSEAMENLGVLETYFYNKWKSSYFLEDKPKELDAIKTIKQYILKAQEQSTKIELIINKSVNMNCINGIIEMQEIHPMTVEEQVKMYNDRRYYGMDELSVEEFKLLIKR